MDTPKIKLLAALAEIDQYYINDEPHTFSIGYCKKDGSLRTKAKVRKSGANPLNGALKPKGQPSGFRTNVKKAGILLLVDCETGQPFSVRIDRLTYYKGMRIWH